ncbi:hypothetical protein HY968_02310 [Candidatus Kaiserbacteria bacterium]|nr:hypothetical protein [Candidatus Kaiserbacteria bacterium]
MASAIKGFAISTTVLIALSPLAASAAVCVSLPPLPAVHRDAAQGWTALNAYMERLR